VNNATASERSKFIIGTYSSPPYIKIEDYTVKGISVSTMECIFNKLKKDVVFDIFPLKRALVELQKNNVDGVFPVSNSGKDNYNRTLPISIKKWYWLTNFRINNANLISGDKRVGAVRGSPEHHWLIENDYKTDTLVTTQKQLFDMFKIGRVDVIIVDENLTHENVVLKNTLQSVQNHWLFIQYESHHLAFSNEALAHNPGLMNTFNQSIYSCNPISLTVTNNEKKLLKNHLGVYFRKVVNFLLLHPSYPSLKLSQPEQDYEAIDQRWSTEVNGGQGDLYDFIINSKLSKFLAELQKNSNNTITEILAIDTDGYSFAISKVTSDLYQGDELKFIKSHGGTKVHISDIVYDQSTQTYQSQVSFPLSKSMAPASVITFGVNIKRVFRTNPTVAR